MCNRHLKMHEAVQKNVTFTSAFPRKDGRQANQQDKVCSGPRDILFNEN